jgi:hypothetical protein
MNIWAIGRERRGSLVDTIAVDIMEPGTIRVDVGPFRPYAVLNRGSASIIASAGTDLAHFLQRVLQKSFPVGDFFGTQAVHWECLALADLTRMILAHGHGGIVLIVPTETGGWLRSLADPFAYRFSPPETTIHDAIRQELSNQKEQGELGGRLSGHAIPDDVKQQIWRLLLPRRRRGMSRGVRPAASLAEVDGAIAVTRDLKVVGFGAKITAAEPVEVAMFRPEPGNQEVVHSRLEDTGGTRHQSAARFVSANRDAVAIVISQDGHVSVMHWDEPNQLVAVVRNVEWWM